MKKIFTLFAGLFIIFALNGQTPVITKLWDRSIQGTAVWDPGEGEWIPGTPPTWMGSTTERGMAYYNGKIYIASRKTGNQIIVLDASTGLQLPGETITLPADPVTGGTLAINTISITAGGKMFVSNLSADIRTVPFKVYTITPKVGEPGYDIATLINWTAGGDIIYRLGDGMGVYINNENNGYIISGDANTAATSASVFKWAITNGVAAALPEIITLADVFPAPTGSNPKRLGIAPQFWPLDMDNFLIDSHSIQPTLYNSTGAMLGTFNGAVRPQTPGICGVAYFNFKNRDFIVAATTNHTITPKAAFEAFEIVGGGFAQAVSLGVVPALGLGGTSNTSYVAPVVVDVKAEEVLFYTMSANNGIAGFKLTIEGGTSVNSAKETNYISVYPVPATDVLNFTSDMSTIEIYNISGQLVRKALNSNKVNLSGLKGSFIVKAVSENGHYFNKVILVK